MPSQTGTSTGAAILLVNKYRGSIQTDCPMRSRKCAEALGATGALGLLGEQCGILT